MSSMIEDINNKQCNEYDIERKAISYIKKRKFEIYKLHVNNFKLNNPIIYELNKTTQLFNLELNDMKVHTIEVNIYLSKNRIMDESYKKWEFDILNSLKISNRTTQKPADNDNTNDIKNVKKLEQGKDQNIKCENGSIEIDDIKFNLPIIKNNTIGEFYQNFMKNRKSNNVLVLENEDFIDSSENLLDILNDNKTNRGRKRRNAMSIPLIELKKSDISEWPCPTFK